MRNVVLVAGLAIVSFSGLAQAQTYPDLGHALAAMGYTGTVWVNSFSTSQPYLGHGVFSPGTPIDPATGNYNARYGMALTGSGTVSVDANGFYMATGTAHNPNPTFSDGSISIDLLSNGNLADGGTVPFNCPASSDCPWTVHFQTKPPLSNPSVRVYRHVEGSVCGGELSIDLNADCRSKLITYFHLPAAYHFTSTDNTDTNYVSTPGNATTTVLCSLIKPLICFTPAQAITVSGPTSGQMNLPYVYSGFAANCTANSTGWTWTVTGGGSITGTATGSQVTVSWPTNGTKLVSATNSGCSGAVGNQTVTIGGGGGGPLQAQFTVSPAAPKVGDTVFLDSSPSTGPLAGAGFDWTFGDGSSGASGPTATHVYAAAGVYNVQLTISPIGCLNTACLSTATHAVTVTANGGAQFIVSPNATQETTFDASTSANVVAGSVFGWDFGDGSPAGSGTIVVHTYAAQGPYKVVLSITPPGCNTAGCQAVASKTVAVGPAPPPLPPSADFALDGSCTNDTCQAQATTAVTLTAVAADATAYNWSFGDGTAGSGRQVIHAWAQAGTYAVSLTAVKGSATATKTRSFVVGPPPLPPSADFSPDGSCTNDTCQAQAATTVTLTAAATDATAYAWSFGDGTAGGGRQVTHAWAQAGTYAVSLTAVKESLAATKTRSFVVSPPPPVSADFSPDGSCTNDTCQAQAATAVTLTAAATDATAYNWSFGDGTAGSGRQIIHTWAQAGTYAVSLTAVKGSSTATKTRTFVVSQAPPPPTKTTLLPLVAESRVVPLQSNDLYVYNPGTTPLDVTLAFRKRGTPDANPPQVTRTIPPSATLFAPDVLSGLFNAKNVAGFLTIVTGINSAEPVITSFNSQGATAGKLFGLTLPGTPVGSAAASGSSQFLVGLHDTADRQSSLGLSNPAGDTATYHLRFYDKTGKLLSESADLALAGHDQRQFAVQELRDSFGIKGLDDYRVEVKLVAGPPVFPFVSDVRLATGDPSFAEPGSFTTPKLYLLGVLTGAGTAKTTWQTDLLLANTGAQAAQTSLTFIGAGGGVKTAQVAVPAGSTTRLENALAKQLGLSNGTGVLTVSSTSPNGIFPLASAETYDNTAPAKRYGQSLVALSDADAADTGKKEVLVGLRQDGSNKTTLWIFNPSGTAGVVDVVYRGLDGTVLGTLAGVKIGAGQLSQLSPSQHPLKAAGVPNGFTVEVVVKSGKALAAAQVVVAGSNDPVYIAGEAR